MDLMFPIEWRFGDSPTVRGELCDTCGRPIHPCDDPECMPWNKPLAERLQWALEENSRLRRCMLTAYDSWAEILDSACETMEMAAMHDESSYKELKRLHAEMRGLMTPKRPGNRRCAPRTANEATGD